MAKSKWQGNFLQFPIIDILHSSNRIFSTATCTAAVLRPFKWKVDPAALWEEKAGFSCSGKKEGPADFAGWNGHQVYLSFSSHLKFWCCNRNSVALIDKCIDQWSSKESPGVWTNSGSAEYCVCVLSAQSCLTLCDPMDCSPPRFFVHGIFQARTLGWVAISFSRGYSWPRGQTQASRTVGRFFTIWATWEAPTTEYYTARKRNGPLIHGTPWMSPKIIILNKGIQTNGVHIVKIHLW